MMADLDSSPLATGPCSRGTACVFHRARGVVGRNRLLRVERLASNTPSRQQVAVETLNARLVAEDESEVRRGLAAEPAEQGR